MKKVILFPYRKKVKKLIIKYQIWVKMLKKLPHNETEIRIYEQVISDLMK